MRDLARPIRLTGEALRMAWSQPVASTMTALFTAGVVALLLATTGQTVVAEQGVLARIDEAGTRSIEVLLEPAAGVTADAVTRVQRLGTVEWVVGFGPATDVRNQSIPGGTRVAVRALYGNPPPTIQLTPTTGPPLNDIIWVGAPAATALGLDGTTGGVIRDATTQSFAVIGTLAATDPLTDLNRQGIHLTNPTPDQLLRRLWVATTTPAAVAPTTEHVLGLLGIQDPQAVSIRTSEQLADVRAAVAGELGQFSRDLVRQALAASLLLILVTTYGATTARRRDYGRRRALGATRTSITTLVLIQQGTLATIGSLLGLAIGTLISHKLIHTGPDPTFTTAIIALAILAATTAALPPALIAATRDPVRILRVP